MKKLSLGIIAFLQAVGLIFYTSLIGFVMTHFRPGQSLLGGTVILSIFMISAVICAGLYLGYAFWLFWERKQTKNAIKLTLYTSLWLILFISFILLRLSL